MASTRTSGAFRLDARDSCGTGRIYAGDEWTVKLLHQVTRAVVQCVVSDRGTPGTGIYDVSFPVSAAGTYTVLAGVNGGSSSAVASVIVTIDDADD